MSNDQQIQEIELNIEQAKSYVDLAKSVERLMKNRDFKKVILDEYFREEAIRLVHLKSDPSFQEKEKQEAIDVGMKAIGNLKSWLYKTEQFGEMAKQSISDSEAELDELRAEV